MDVFERMTDYDYGEVHLKRDAGTGLRAIVAIHDTRLGPALGGCRFLSYAREEDAVVDALRLARGMTYKAALAGIPHGGGKSVLIKPPTPHFDRAALFLAFGRFVEDLGGRYITAEDSGTGLEDMDVIRTVTKNVCGVDQRNGGSGDPSPFTALGVRRGIEACVKFRLGRGSLEGIHVAVQGVGHVGYHLCKELHATGARISVADVDPLKAERAKREFDATIVSLDQIFDVECDVLAPCALGSALNDQTVPRIKAGIIAGAANNQLATPSHGDDLNARGILYAPDYAINAGGLINVALEVEGYDVDKARERTHKIYDTVYEIAERSSKTLTPTYRVADLMVEEKLARLAKPSWQPRS
ncbi:Leu/Phe/Val dehydrogenase [Chondromyces crocatus]|uniref:Leucine dehydrogenase n=1 Tax=Chondromyces crocatus TaxID=52 RepID=A0A0K1E7E6_CHOCO|nr:Glu/Leu/Phe/Val dehydrogenase dimerization domain-containing protein [Chondromyces crocatus]AKT36592.1 leucine dehydrogenase [Chondromyces crocatus]